jgi:hypothetical protein
MKKRKLNAGRRTGFLQNLPGVEDKTDKKMKLETSASSGAVKLNGQWAKQVIFMALWSKRSA